MTAVVEIVLDAARPYAKESALSPRNADLEKFITTLKRRQKGTLYLLTGKTYFVLGVESGIWLAHLYTGDSRWLSNPQAMCLEAVEFNFANTATPIQVRFTCSEHEAIDACHAFFAAPNDPLPGNWVSEYDGEPSKAGY